MTGAGGRAFVRLVVVISLMACGAAAAVSLGEIATRPYVVAASEDGVGLGLTEEVARYAHEVMALHGRVDEEASK